ncbi:MAG TPA: hypothetical protein ENN58_02240, partial [bacterium]|nr:hypothetical protein [bacterium]
MKSLKTIRFSAFLALLLLSVIFTAELEAQCQNCTGSNLTHVMETPKFAPEWTVIYSNSVKGGQYILFEVKKDFVYRWSTLGSEDYHPDVYPTRKSCTTDADCGTGTVCVGTTGNKRCELAFDTELTLSKAGCTETGDVLEYNWNAVFRNQSEIEWKSDFNGTVYLYVTKYSCDTTTDLNTTIKWQMIDSTQCDTCQYDSPRPYDGTDTHKNPANAPDWTKVGNSIVDYPDPDNPTVYRQCTDLHPTYGVLGYEFGYCFGYEENIKGGDHQTYTVEEGKWYRWTTCSDPNFDTQLTLFKGDVCGMSFLAYSDDVEDPSCATNLQSTIVWKAEFSGNVTLLTNRYNCSICYQSPNIHDPFGHCSYTSLEWQRYDCHNCSGGLVGTYTPDDTASTISGITKNKYIEFNLTGGREYRFKAASIDGGTTFKPTIAMRIKGATPCSGNVISQGDEIVWKPIEDVVVEVLVSGNNCSDPGSKTASVEHQVIYDPSDRFEDNPNGWSGITFDSATDLFITDINVYANTWEEAFNACLDHEFSYTTGTWPKLETHTLDDWRLPNINEISSII